MKLAAAAQMKELDGRAIREYGIPSIDLMERAAEALRDAVLELLPERNSRCRVSVLCGSGNNGGDGIAAARLLFLKGVQVRVFLCGDYEKLTPDALAETGRLSECGVELETFDPASGAQQSWICRSHAVVDALFGVGLSRDIAADSPYAAAIEWMNRCEGKVVAADIASGVAADSGCILGCGVKADRTVTFTLPKVGQFVGDGAIYSGEVQVCDIGIPENLVKALSCPVQTVSRAFAEEALPRRRVDGHKGNFGEVLIVGGSVGYTGAPYLAAAAAVRSGCGLVHLGVPQEIWPILAGKCVCAMPFPLPEQKIALRESAFHIPEEKTSRCDVLAIGPGLGRSEKAEKLVHALMELPQPVVLDADGINALEGHIDVLDGRKGRVTILTPHDGEFARIGGELAGKSRVQAAVEFAREHDCILVLKGHRTVTATPQGTALVNTTGNSGLAKGGSGDVLTGLIASLLAQGATPVQAAALGVWLHGRSGDLAARTMTPYAMTPEDVTGSLPAAFQELLRG